MLARPISTCMTLPRGSDSSRSSASGVCTYSRCTDDAKPGANRSTASIRRSRLRLGERVPVGAVGDRVRVPLAPDRDDVLSRRREGVVARREAHGQRDRGAREPAGLPVAVRGREVGAVGAEQLQPVRRLVRRHPRVARHRVGQRPDDEAEPVAERRVRGGEGRRRGVRRRAPGSPRCGRRRRRRRRAPGVRRRSRRRRRGARCRRPRSAAARRRPRARPGRRRPRAGGAGPAVSPPEPPTG